MIGKVQDVVTAAVVVKAADSVGKDPQFDVTADQNARQSAVKGAAESGKIGAERQDGGRNVDVKGDGKPAEEKPRMDEESVDLMTKELNEIMDKIDCNLQFKYQKEVNLMTVKMIDKDTDKVLKEFPPEDMVESMVKTKEWLGAFIDRNA